MTEEKNKGGRPLKFKTVKELEDKIEAYIKPSLDEEGNIRLNDNGFPVRPLTITGLALALDTTRETLCDYQNKDEFSDTVNRAKLIVENYYEQRLTYNSPTGSIFALKNFGWEDRSQQEQTVKATVNWPLPKTPLDG